MPGDISVVAPPLAAEIRQMGERIAELEALLREAVYILANNALEGDATAGDLSRRINEATARGRNV